MWQPSSACARHAGGEWRRQAQFLPCATGGALTADDGSAIKHCNLCHAARLTSPASRCSLVRKLRRRPPALRAAPSPLSPSSLLSVLLAVIAGYGTAAIFSLLAVQSFLVSKRSPSWYVCALSTNSQSHACGHHCVPSCCRAAELNSEQRKLLGLEAVPAKVRLAPAKLSTPVPLLVPPQRGSRAIPTSMLTPASDISGGPAPSPGSRGAAREVTSPGQLRRILLEFDEQVGAGGGASAGGGLSPSEYGVFSGHDGAVQPSFSPSNTYRPSAVPKGMAAVPVRGDGPITPSTHEQKLAVMKRLHVTQDSLEVRGRHCLFALGF